MRNRQERPAHFGFQISNPFVYGFGMFDISAQAIDPHALRAAMGANAAGGFVCFEGWVRDLNLERAVQQLAFEADAQLAANEFAKIEAEAREKFEVLEICCVHRTGVLAIGELAVWIGVTSVHRDPAFGACRYLIDELKSRLPIWKKEHYGDGDSGWLNHP